MVFDTRLRCEQTIFPSNFMLYILFFKDRRNERKLRLDIYNEVDNKKDKRLDPNCCHTLCLRVENRSFGRLYYNDYGHLLIINIYLKINRKYRKTKDRTAPAATAGFHSTKICF